MPITTEIQKPVGRPSDTPTRNEQDTPENRAKALAPARKAPEPAGDEVVCRVTKRGDGKIFTGNETGDAETFDKNDEFLLPKAMADGLEDLGYIEIV